MPTQYALELINEYSQLKARQAQNKFLSKLADNSEYTKAQTIYHFLYLETFRPDYPFKKEIEQELDFHKRVGIVQNAIHTQINKYLSESHTSLLFEQLYFQRERKQKRIMEGVEKLYHFTHIPPSGINGNFLLPSSAISPFKDEIFPAVFASSTRRSEHLLKWRSSKGLQYFAGFSENTQDRYVVLVDMEYYLKHPIKAYGYEVDKIDFVAVVSLGGRFNGEFISFKPAKILNKNKPLVASLDTVAQQGIQIFFAKNEQSYFKITKMLPLKNGKKQFEWLLSLSKKGIINHYNSYLLKRLAKLNHNINLK